MYFFYKLVNSIWKESKRLKTYTAFVLKNAENHNFSTNPQTE